MNDDQIVRLEKRIERERAARHEAETMLESKSRELYLANVALRELADDLERQVETRTRELAAALEDAHAATRVKSQFLATMSHEIRTPLFGVIGTAELLEQSDLNDQQSAHVRTIRSSGESLLTLLNEILDLSKLDATRLELEVGDFDLEAETVAVGELFRPVASSHGLTLRVDVSPQPRLLRGDKLRLRQIVSNLLSNAVKFTAAGEVELTVTTQAEGNATRVTVRVSDTGPGIAEGQRDELFEEFRQGDPSTTRIHGGSGLGLAIVSRLVRLMDGDVALDSIVGKGSVFTVHVMMESGAERDAHSGPPLILAQEPLSPDLSSLRVLLVEDNPVSRMVSNAMLEKLGCTAAVAEDGEQAVALVSSDDIDIVLMDLHMPVLDGLEATRRIRALPLAHQPRIVALTANAFASDREACRLAGMDDFLAKPYSLAELRELCVRFASHGAVSQR